MPNNTPKLGESLRMLGSGAARKAGDSAVKANQKKKKRLDNIMGEIKKSRKSY